MERTAEELATYIEELKADRKARERAKAKEKRVKHKVRKNNYDRRWCIENPEKRSKTVRRTKLKQMYGITEAEWEAKFNAQGRCCGICKATKPKMKRRWHTDHCEKTGKLRSILCHSCNTTVANHSAEHLRKCADYVDYWVAIHATNNYKEYNRGWKKQCAEPSRLRPPPRGEREDCIFC